MGYRKSQKAADREKRITKGLIDLNNKIFPSAYAAATYYNSVLERPKTLNQDNETSQPSTHHEPTQLLQNYVTLTLD
jgi:hypothetical protein